MIYMYKIVHVNKMSNQEPIQASLTESFQSTKDWKQLYDWVVYLNQYEGLTYKNEQAARFIPIEEDSDVRKYIKKLCKQRVANEITEIQFYLTVYNCDCFDANLLGPEYSNFSELFDEACKNGTLPKQPY